MGFAKQQADAPVKGELKAALAAARIAVLSQYDARMKDALRIENKDARHAAIKAIKDARKSELAAVAAQAVKDTFEKQQQRRETSKKQRASRRGQARKP